MAESVVPSPLVLMDDLRAGLERIQQSLDAAAHSMAADRDAALDDVLAARLLTATLLLRLQSATST